jgi:hypothetical protein
MATNLCENCRRFNIHAWDAENRMNGHLGLPAFAVVDGANSGCSFCTFLLDALLEEYPEAMQKMKMRQWFRIYPYTSKLTSSSPRSGLAIRGLTVVPYLGYDMPTGGSSKHTVYARLEAVADPGNTHALLIIILFTRGGSSARKPSPSTCYRLSYILLLLIDYRDTSGSEWRYRWLPTYGEYFRQSPLQGNEVFTSKLH